MCSVVVSFVVMRYGEALRDHMVVQSNLYNLFFSILLKACLI